MVLTDRPGCFGLPSAVNAASASCRVCAFGRECVTEASVLMDELPDECTTQGERQSFALTLQALAGSPRSRVEGRVAPTVVASSRGVARVALSQAQLDNIATLPQRVASPFKKLLERGWFEFAKSELRAGRNPATKGWQKVFCDALLDGGLPRRDLELALVEKLRLSPKSARVQVSVGIAVFAAGKLANEKFGRFSLSPN